MPFVHSAAPIQDASPDAGLTTSVEIIYALSNQSGTIAGARAIHTWRQDQQSYVGTLRSDLPENLLTANRLAIQTSGIMYPDLGPAIGSVEFDSGPMRRATRTDTDIEMGRLQFQSELTQGVVRVFAPPMDILGLAYFLAAHPEYSLGSQVTLVDNLGIRPISLRESGRETIKLGDKQVETLRYSFSTVDDRDAVRIWVSTGQQNVPIRLQMETPGGWLIFDAQEVKVTSGSLNIDAAERSSTER